MSGVRISMKVYLSVKTSNPAQRMGEFGWCWKTAIWILESGKTSYELRAESVLTSAIFQS